MFSECPSCGSYSQLFRLLFNSILLDEAHKQHNTVVAQLICRLTKYAALQKLNFGQLNAQSTKCAALQNTWKTKYIYNVIQTRKLISSSMMKLCQLYELKRWKTLYSEPYDLHFVWYTWHIASKQSLNKYLKQLLNNKKNIRCL